MEAGITSRLLDSIVQYGAIGIILFIFIFYHFKSNLRQMEKQQETLEKLVDVITQVSTDSRAKDERISTMLDKIGQSVSELSKTVQIQNKVTQSIMERYEKEIRESGR